RRRRGALARPRRRRDPPPRQPPLGPRTDVLLRLWRLGAGARDQRLSAVDQIPVLKADRRRVDARDAVSRHAVAAGLRQDAEGGFPASLWRLLGRLGGRLF